MNGPTGIHHLLNGPDEEEPTYCTRPNTLPNTLPSPSQRNPTPTSPTVHAHKYSNSTASTSSFASFSTTNYSGSHTRNSSLSTHPESHPKTPSPTTDLFPSTYLNSCGNNKMADMVEPFDLDDSVAKQTRHLGNNQHTIDLTEDDRADSPTDAVMPMIRRGAAGMPDTSR